MDNNENKPKKRHPITVMSVEVGNLAYKCRKAGYSLRLLAALMDTKSYGVVYQSMISAEKGRGGARGPTLKCEKELLKTRSKHLLFAMEMKKISPRRWCTAYDVELYGLFDPVSYESNTDIPLIDFLMEDFPEAFGFIEEPYTHAYQEALGFEHIKNRKRGIHIYKTKCGTVVSKSNAHALGIACKVTGLMYQKERLDELLKNGVEAALNWVPGRNRSLPLRNDREKEISESLKMQGNINDMTSELAALPREEYANRGQLQRADELYRQLAKYGVSEESVNNTVKAIRVKAGR